MENDRLASYVRMYAVLAGGVLAVSASYWPSVTAGMNWQALTFALLIAIAGLATLTVRIGSQRLSWSWDETALVIGLVLLPAEQLVICAAAGKLVSEVSRRIPPHKALFNVSKQTVAVAVAAITADVIAGGPPVAPFTGAGAAAVAVGATVYILITDVSVALAISLATDVSPYGVLLRGGRMRLFSFVANTVLGFGMLVAIEWDHRLLLGVPPLALCLSLIYAIQLRTETERETWRRLAEATDRLTDVDFESVLRTSVSSASELFSADAAEVEVRVGDGAARLVRGTSSGVTWDGAPQAAPTVSGEVITVPLTSLDEKVDVGVLRLRFHGKVKLTERERYTLRTFAAALCTALRNADAYSRSQQDAERNAYNAAHDPLTDLPNRRHLMTEGERALERRPRPGILALMLIDLDHFKEVNDTLGHPTGDDVLRKVARRLADAADPDDIVVRLGGDEFAILLVGLPAPALAVHRARQLLSVFDQPFDVGDMRITISASGGVATAPLRGGVSELLRRADVAMYQAKREGQAVSLYARSRDTADVGQLALGGELREALDRQQFTVNFQPIVDLATGEVVAAEALARWHHPARGDLDPRRFLTAVERSGMLPDFAEAVLDTSLAAATRWRDAGHPIPVAVNVSPRSLLDPRFPELVERRLRNSGVAGDELILEITETLTLSQLDVVDEVLGALREQRVRLALDDFGTGYSSLAVLARVPVDELKIDRSFVAAMDTSPEAAAVVRTTIELARGLGLLVVAEGVENEQQRAELFGLGCAAGQGHLFARGLPADRFAAALRRGPLAPPLSSQAQVIRMPANRASRRLGRL